MKNRHDRWDNVSDLASEDVFDSRDVQAWIDDLASRKPDPDDAEEVAESDWTEEDEATLKALLEICDSCGREWRHGVAYIRESYWRDYCEELADDCGYTGSDKSQDNPLLQYIDWDAWASAVAQDYSTIEIDGTTFYYRD